MNGEGGIDPGANEMSWGNAGTWPGSGWSSVMTWVFREGSRISGRILGAGRASWAHSGETRGGPGGGASCEGHRWREGTEWAWSRGLRAGRR